MRGITRRGHLALSGLIGGLIGVLVVVTATSPATNSAAPSPSATGRGPDVRKVLPRDWDTSTAQRNQTTATQTWASGELNQALEVRLNNSEGQPSQPAFVSVSPTWGDPFDSLEIRLSNSQ
jgi:hypothetical protein